MTFTGLHEGTAMGQGQAAMYGILDATPFAIGLAIAVWSVGETFAPGRLLLVALLLGTGVRGAPGDAQRESVRRRRDQILADTSGHQRIALVALTAGLYDGTDQPTHASDNTDRSRFSSLAATA